MKAQTIVGILIIILGLFLIGDATGEYGSADNHSEVWLGSIFFILGILLCATKQNII